MTNNKSLRRLLMGWLLPALIALLLAGALTAYLVALHNANRAYDRALLDTSLAIAAQVKIEQGRTRLELPSVAQKVLLTDKYDQVYYLAVGPQGEFLAGHKGLPLPPARPADRNWIYYDGYYLGRPVRVAALFSPAAGGEIQVMAAETLVKRNNLLGEILFGMLVPEILLGLAVVALVWFGIERGLAPLNRLRQEIAARSSQDLRPVPEEHAPEEVRPVVHEINALLARLDETLTAQRRFISNAAHQIRTPIAALQAQLDAARRESDPAELHATLERVHAAAGRTAHLTHQLLTLARVEPGGQPPAEPQPVELDELVSSAAADWMPQALAKNIDLGFELAPAPLSGNPLLLREMLANLVDNALRYTPAGGQVTVRTRRNDTEALLTIEDNGPGIPAAERDRILERFYRVPGSPGDGCGLGLAIVQEIARGHGATVEIGTPPCGRGTIAQVRFPLRAAPAPDSPA